MKTATSGFHRGDPSIRMGKSGQISLSKCFTKTLGLKPKDKAAICQDEDDPDGWYLLIGDADGFPLRKYKNMENLGFNSSVTAKSFFDYAESPEAISIGCLLETKPIDKPEDYEGKGQFYRIVVATMDIRITDEERTLKAEVA